jgi:hypothetical protein
MALHAEGVASKDSLSGSDPTIEFGRYCLA